MLWHDGLGHFNSSHMFMLDYARQAGDCFGRQWLLGFGRRYRLLMVGCSTRKAHGVGSECVEYFRCSVEQAQRRRLAPH